MLDEKVVEQSTRAFIRARVQLMHSRPFWAHLVMKMPLRWMDEEGQLSKTDGETLFINPSTYLTLTKGEQVSVLVHEVLHCVALHLTRCGSRDPQRWNIAGDIYIANVIEAEGFESIALSENFMSQVGINRVNYRTMTTEAIYDALPKSKQQKQSQGNGQGKGQGRGKSGGCQHWNGEGGCYKEKEGGSSSASRSQAEQRWRQNVIEAGQLAGNAPGAWRELVKAAMPKPPFHVPLLDFLHRGMGGDSDWSMLNRRWLSRGMYMPQEYSQVMGEIAIAVDTSGSMDSNTQLREAFGYIRAFREEHACKLHLIQCDHDCIDKAQYRVYEEWEPLPETFQVVGRGGTSFDPPFELVRERKIEPCVLIYITDGYGACSVPKPPNYDVMWVVINGDSSFTPPFGEVIHASVGR
jgi:predicted metal-dependent peptidase